LIGNFLYIFNIFVKIQIVDISQDEFFINIEVLLDFLLQGVPMSRSHCGVSEVRNKREEYEPFLDLILNTEVSVALLIAPHFLERFELVLDFIFHVTWIRLDPLRVHVGLEDFLHLLNEVPESDHILDLLLNSFN